MSATNTGTSGWSKSAAPATCPSPSNATDRSARSRCASTARPPGSTISCAATTSPMGNSDQPPPARAGGVLEIDLTAIAENWRRLGARLASPARAAAVVEADAYGLGMAQGAPALAEPGCTLFFVATLDEGLALRRVLPAVEIAVFDGLLPGTSGDFVQARLIPVLNDLSQIAAWCDPADTQALPAMIHVDTGMARLGLAPTDIARLGATP